jgi:hypothetical protein
MNTRKIPETVSSILSHVPMLFVSEYPLRASIALQLYGFRHLSTRLRSASTTPLEKNKNKSIDMQLRLILIHYKNFREKNEVVVEIYGISLKF